MYVIFCNAYSACNNSELGGDFEEDWFVDTLMEPARSLVARDHKR